MTKKAKAQQIFDSLWFKGVKDRKKIIQRFIDVLDMTPAGAATYYANCKKAALPEVATAALAPSIKQQTQPISTNQPDWVVKVTNKHNEVCKLAEQLYGVDMSRVKLHFNLRGLSAGQAYRKYGQYGVRYNNEACIKHLDDTLNDTIPHEVAHVVCFMKPQLGNKHNVGWKRVCRALGGTGERCHSLQLTSAKKRVRYIYKDGDSTIEVGPKVHKKIQNGYCGSYTSKATRLPILSQNFIKQITK